MLLKEIFFPWEKWFQVTVRKVVVQESYHELFVAGREWGLLWRVGKKSYRADFEFWLSKVWPLSETKNCPQPKIFQGGGQKYFFPNNPKTQAQTSNPVLAHPPVVFFFSEAHYLLHKSRKCPNNVQIGRKWCHPNTKKLAPFPNPPINETFSTIFFPIKSQSPPSFPFWNFPKSHHPQKKIPTSSLL